MSNWKYQENDEYIETSSEKYMRINKVLIQLIFIVNEYTVYGC